ALALFTRDALAAKLGIGRRRRAILCLAEAVVLWPVVAMWGHPEDSLAVGFAMGSLLLAFDESWGKCGWAFGLAVALQPVVLLMLPVMLLTLVPLRQWARLTLGISLPS